ARLRRVVCSWRRLPIVSRIS
ncbi:hypothetical protein A0H81_04262, partial [Grifola frondosa]